MKILFFFALPFLTMAFSMTTLADSWLLPEKRTICSKNNKYCLKVIPKKLTSQLDYFEDKVAIKENAGADKRLKKNNCRGIFYARDANGILRKRWEINLVNEVSPVDVLVSNEGNYIVTFDNWHSVGYGDDAVAIYEGSKGNLIKKFGLSDFLTERDIDNLPHSVSSIWWGGDHFLDYKNRNLVLLVTKGKRSSDENAEYFEIRTDLTNGQILDEKRDRLPSLQFVLEPTKTETSGVAPEANITDSACFSESNSIQIPSTEMIRRAISQVQPPYPPAARAVRATGQVTIEILVTPDGNVSCARAVSGHPLLRAAVVAAVRKWKFETAAEPYAGFITFEGTSALVHPDGIVVKHTN